MTSNRSVKYEEQADLEGTVNMTTPKFTETIENIEDLNSPNSQASTTLTQNSRYSTLDEPVLNTLKRDVYSFIIRLKHVFIHSKSETHKKLLREWDLFGPLVLTFALAMTLTMVTSSQPEELFCGIFLCVWGGSFIVALNAKLLGGHVSVFQAVSVLGYCMVPMNLAALAMALIPRELGVYARLPIDIVGLIWATRNGMPFMESMVSSSKKALAVYPVLLFYFFLGWYILAATQ